MLSLPTILASIPLGAQPPFKGILPEPLDEITNSFVVTLIVTLILLIVSRRVTKQMNLVPRPGLQNFFEAIVVFLYDGLESVVGKHMIRRCFPLLATIFLFTLTSNWLGLFPGVGTIGFGKSTGAPLTIDAHDMTPLLRPATADLNTTLGMALLFMIFWFIWTMQELGFVGFLEHTFAPKGGLAGVMKLVLMPIFFFVGIIELISIAFRPVSLSLRLFGNIFAGENLMHVMSGMGDTFHMPAFVSFIISILLPLPFFFLELLVGVLQAIVFTLLCAVYIQLTTTHDDEHAHGHGDEKGAHDHTEHGTTAPATASH